MGWVCAEEPGPLLLERVKMKRGLLKLGSREGGERKGKRKKKRLVFSVH